MNDLMIDIRDELRNADPSNRLVDKTLGRDRMIYHMQNYRLRKGLPMLTADDLADMFPWPACRQGRTQREADEHGLSLARSTAPAGGQFLREELRAHLRKAPQVMVKITGKSRGVAGVRDHLEYIGDRAWASHAEPRPVRHLTWKA
jgi:hypothetical protein